jgi:hypothetical protein
MDGSLARAHAAGMAVLATEKRKRQRSSARKLWRMVKVVWFIGAAFTFGKLYLGLPALTGWARTEQVAGMVGVSVTWPVLVAFREITWAVEDLLPAPSAPRPVRAEGVDA